MSLNKMDTKTQGEIQRKVSYRVTVDVKSQKEDRQPQGKGGQRADSLLALSRNQLSNLDLLA